MDAMKEILPLVPELTSLFLPGFICILIYNWLNNNKMETTYIITWSLFISYFMVTFYSAVHAMVLTKIDFNEAVKAVIYYISAALLSVAIAKIKHTKTFGRALYWIAHKTVNSDIFDDAFDYDKPMRLHIFIKNADYSYIGKLALKEEKGLDSWIVLVDYAKLYNQKQEPQYYLSTDDIKSSVAINLHDVESMQIIYENDSKVWENISG